ncbi:MAG: hypothetical protein QME68_01805 [Elusimicrobiota bacterium]|nr:hypothetical protein [Elusimicrobiota bacterium]
MIVTITKTAQAEIREVLEMALTVFFAMAVGTVLLASAVLLFVTGTLQAGGSTTVGSVACRRRDSITLCSFTPCPPKAWSKKILKSEIKKMSEELGNG